MSLDREMQSHKHLEDYLELMTGRRVGHESAKSFVSMPWWFKYLTGNVLDIGYKGNDANTLPIVPNAWGIDADDYDGVHLPFSDESQNAVYSSHCLEHIEDDVMAIKEWFRVLKIGGHLIIAVPHEFLYERGRKTDHKHFYTPATLMLKIEKALKPNSYRLRSLRDNDMFYDYSIPPKTHPVGSYEIELVLEKIKAPEWRL